MREALQTAPTGGSQSLEPDFTLEELLAELDALSLPEHGDTPTREPGGLDRYMVAERRKCSRTTAEVWLIQLEKQGVLTSRYEWDEARRARVRVWRRA